MWDSLVDQGLKVQQHPVFMDRIGELNCTNYQFPFDFFSDLWKLKFI